MSFIQRPQQLLARFAPAHQADEKRPADKVGEPKEGVETIAGTDAGAHAATASRVTEAMISIDGICATH
jgi:hypothetical protein